MSEKIFEATFDLAPVGMCHCTNDGVIVRVNRRFTEICGHPAVELFGRHCERIIHPDEQASHREELRQLLTRETRGSGIEMRCLTGRGETVRLRLCATPLSDEAGNAHLFLLVIEDITGEEKEKEKEKEKELRESEERLRLSLRAAGQGLYDLDLTTGNAKITPEYATMLGYDPATFQETNTKWAERLHPDDRERTYATYEAYIRGDIPNYELEFRQRTCDGGWLWTLSIGGIMHRDEHGKPLRMLGTHTNIDARKRTEEALRTSEERFRQISDNIDAVFWIATPSLDQIEYINPAFERIWGWPNAELMDNPALWLEAIVPEDRERVEAAFSSLANGSRTDQEYRICRKDGEMRVIRDRGFTVQDPGDRVLRIVGIAEDITKLKQGEMALRESEARYRRAERGTRDGLWEFEISTGEAYHSPRWLEILGYSADDLPAHVESFNSLIHPDEKGRVEAMLDAHLKDGTTFEVDVRLRHKEGGFVWVTFRGAVDFDADMEPKRVAGSISDITERKYAEERRRESELRLHLVLENMSDGFFILDRDWRYYPGNNDSHLILQQHFVPDFFVAFLPCFYVGG